MLPCAGAGPLERRVRRLGGEAHDPLHAVEGTSIQTAFAMATRRPSAEWTAEAE